MGSSGDVVLTEMDITYLKEAYKRKARGEKYNYLQFCVELLMKKEKLERKKQAADHKRKIREEEEEEEVRKQGFVDQGHLPRLDMFIPRLDSSSKMKKPRFSDDFIDVSAEELMVDAVEEEEKDWELVDEEKEMMMKKKKNKKSKKKVKKSTVSKSTEENKNGSPLKKKKKTPAPPPVEPSTIPIQLVQKIEELGGTKPYWLTAKLITESDTKHGLQRFFIPRCEKLVDLMTKGERTIVENKGGSLPVIVVDQTGKEWNLHFRFWKVGSKGTYVLTHGWNNLVNELGLRSEVQKSMLHLWSFRQPENNNNLCFAINIANK